MQHGSTVLDLDCLRTFVVIADEGTFSKAAEVVGRSPSAVTMQVKKLENQLGATLFTRNARSVELTKDGEKLLSQARRLLALSNEAVAQFTAPGLQGRVKFGVPNDIAESVLPTILKNLASNYPSITVDVMIDTSENLLARAERVQLDLAVINYTSGSAAPPGELLAKGDTVWVGAKGGVAYRRNPLPLALYGDGCIWRDAGIAQLKAKGRAYRIAYLSPQTMMQRAAIKSDIAVAPLPRSYVTDEMTILSDAEGFSDLPPFEVRLLTPTEMTPAVTIVSDLVRSAFAS